MAVNDDDFANIMEGLAQAGEIMRGEADPATYALHIPEAVDVKGIRHKTGLTQPAFSAKFGFSLGTVRDWEQGRYQPKASDRVLLTVIDREPQAVLKALSA